MITPQEVADKAIEFLANNNCASLIIVSPYFEDDTYYRIKTADDTFEDDDIENLISATEEVLKILKNIRLQKKVDV